MRRSLGTFRRDLGTLGVNVGTLGGVWGHQEGLGTLRGVFGDTEGVVGPGGWGTLRDVVTLMTGGTGGRLVAPRVLGDTSGWWWWHWGVLVALGAVRGHKGVVAVGGWGTRRGVRDTEEGGGTRGLGHSGGG